MCAFTRSEACESPALALALGAEWAGDAVARLPEELDGLDPRGDVPTPHQALDRLRAGGVRGAVVVSMQPSAMLRVRRAHAGSHSE